MLDFEVMCNPEKYGYVECPNCNGYGSSLYEKNSVCNMCKGSGLVKKEKLITTKEGEKNVNIK
jgi:DnaJ-class molecular chaperone